MKEDLEKKLVKDYPMLYEDHYLAGGIHPGFKFGFECSDGWFKLINTLSNELEKLIRKYRETETGVDEDWMPRAVQVKEKFGGLRFYMSGGTDAMFAIISKAEQESYNVCEECGDHGNLQKNGWLKTRCPTHWGDLK